MSDTSKPIVEPARRAAGHSLAPAGHGISHDASLVTDKGDVLQVAEERLNVTKRRMSLGSIRIGTVMETVEAVADADLQRYRVEVTRVPVGRVVIDAPMARAEGDTTIVPVVEERLVMVKQLFLVEEVHIRHVLDSRTVSEPVTLRRQRAVIERLDPRGRTAVSETTLGGEATLAAEEGHRCLGG